MGILDAPTPDATPSRKGKLQLAGDLGGTAGSPTVPALASKAPLASPAFTGTPTAPTASPGAGSTQLATTAYVDAAAAAAAAGLDVKQSVRLGSTANVTISSPGATIDGVTVTNGDRILLKNQTTGSQNGIYIFNGAASAMTRASDADSSIEVTSGMFVFITEGTAGANKGYVLTTPDPITLGTTSLAFTQFSSIDVPDATASVKGIVQLAGDLGGSAAAPTTKGRTATVTVGVTGQTADYICDGTADNVQLQAAIDFLTGLGGGTLFVRRGTYDIQTRIKILSSNITVRGEGQATKFVLANAANQEIWLVGNGNVGDTAGGDGPTVIPCNDVHFYDFYMDGNKANQDYVNFALVRYGASATRNLIRYRSDAQTSYGAIVDNVHAINGRQNGISIESHAFATVRNCTAENCDNFGIWFENGSQILITGNYTRNNVLAGIKGLSAGAKVIGNECKGDQGSSIVLQSVGGVLANNISYRAGWQGATVSPSTGIGLSACRGMIVMGNHIYASYGHGMNINGCDYMPIIGNTFRRNGQYTDNTYSDMRFTFEGGGTPCNNNTIIGNTFENDTATFYDNKSKYNISSDSPTAHSGNTFIANKLGTPGTSTIFQITAGNSFVDMSGVNPVGYHNYTYLSDPQIIDPKDGNLLYGTGYTSTTAVSIADGSFAGQIFDFVFAQDVGGKQLTWSANVKWPGGKAPIFSGVANTADRMTFIWDGTNWNGMYSSAKNRYQNIGYLANPQTLDPNAYEVILGAGYDGTTTVNIAAGKYAGQEFTFIFAQDVGNKLITWGSNVQWNGKTPPVLSTSPSTNNVFRFTWDGTNWNGSMLSKGGNQKLIGSDFVGVALPTQSAPLLVVNGVTGATTYAYKIVAVNDSGNDGIPSASQQVTNGNATLNGSNYISMQWTANPGAVKYKVLRSVSGGAFDLLTTTSSLALSDQGQYTPTTYTPAATQPGGSFIGSGAGLTGIPESGVTNLTSDLAAKAPLASPAFTGTPTAPTASPNTNNTQLATTAYVDAATQAAAAGLDIKQSVRAATAAALASNSRSGNVLTASANGALAAVDGVTLVLNDRVLVKDESTGANNGIYYVSAIGSGGAPWTLTRATDADSSAEVNAGMFTFVEEGTANGDKAFALTTNNPITLNTTALVFAQFSGGGGGGTWGTIAGTLSDQTDLQSALNAKQATDQDLTDIAGLSPTNDDFMQRKAGAWTNRTPAQAKTDLALAKGDVGLGNVDNTSDSTKNSATATLTNKRITKRVVALTDGANIATNSDNGDLFTVTLGGNRTMDNPTGTPTDGQQIMYRIAQDGTGSRTISWGSAFRGSTDLPLPTLTTTASKTDYVGFQWNATDSKWDCIAANKGF